MSFGTSETVDCPRCGAAVDPSETGGRCIECGERRLTADGRVALTDGGEATAEPDGGADDETAAEPGEGGARPDAEAGTDGHAATDGQADGVASGAAETDGSGDGGDDEMQCPECGTVLAVDDNFCFSCGTDVSNLQPGGELSNCPGCEAEVESDDSFCRQCGENLDAHRPSDGGSGQPDRGESADPAGQQETVRMEGQRDGPSIVLVVRNREIQVTDGDSVGREVRSVIMDTGGDEDDAVRVHREHVRFEHDDEDDQFYLVDEGKNPTVVNGEELEEGDSVPVSPGDRIELSNVAKIRVQDD